MLWFITLVVCSCVTAQSSLVGYPYPTDGMSSPVLGASGNTKHDVHSAMLPPSAQHSGLVYVVVNTVVDSDDTTCGSVGNDISLNVGRYGADVFSVDVAATGTVRVNAIADGWQRYPHVTALDDSHVLVTWTSGCRAHSPDGSEQAVVGRVVRIDRGGGSPTATPLGAQETVLNEVTLGRNWISAAVAFNASAFFVGFQGRVGNDHRSAAVGQFVWEPKATDGVAITRVGSDVNVAETKLRQDKNFVRMAFDRHAGVGFVTWSDSLDYDPVLKGAVQGRAFTWGAAGVALLGAEVRVNHHDIDGQYNSQVAALGGGVFALTYSMWDKDSSCCTNYRWGVFTRRIRVDTAAAPTGVVTFLDADDLLVNTHTPYDQDWAVVGALAGGRYVAAWSSGAHYDGDSYGIGARVIRDGAAIEPAEWLLNVDETIGPQWSVSVAAFGDAAAFAWASRPSKDSSAPWHIRARFMTTACTAPSVFDAATGTCAVPFNDVELCPKNGGGKSEQKLAVCHTPSRSPMMLCLPESAISDHLGHGDCRGDCPCVSEPAYRASYVLVGGDSLGGGDESSASSILEVTLA